MKKKKKQQKPAPVVENGKKPVNKKRILILAVGSLLSCLAYFGLVRVSEIIMKITIIAYMLICAFAIIAYFIYNRGIVSGEITERMLPTTMSPTEKKDYIAECMERRRKSKCLLVLMFIFLCPLTLDFMKLFVVDTLFPGVFD